MRQHQHQPNTFNVTITDYDVKTMQKLMKWAGDGKKENYGET
jgi:hypothetical protein